MTNPQDTIARLLCNDAAARKIAHEEAAPCFDESAAVVQEYWRALAAALSFPNHSSVGREAVARIATEIDNAGPHATVICVTVSDAKAILALLPSVPADVSEDAFPSAHDCYEGFDPAAPEAIRDRNGEVVLGLCKVCGAGEIELEEPCDERQARLAALASPSPDTPQPFGYWVEQRHVDPVLLRKPAYIPKPSDLCKVTPLYAASPDTPEKRMLLDLLAVIHRDVGHYTDEHGLAASVADAMLLSSERLPDTPEIEALSAFTELMDFDLMSRWSSDGRQDFVAVIKRAKEAVAALASPSPGTPEIEGRGQ